MTQKTKTRNDFSALWVFLPFYLASFLFLWLNANPALIYQHQQPAFFTDSLYFHKALAYPGGLAQYAAAFILQFYQFSFAGALWSFAIVVAISLSLYSILKNFNPRQNLIAPTALAIALVSAMHAGYFYRLSFSVAVLAPLLLFLLYTQINLPILWRFVLNMLLTAVAYYLAAAPFFIFVGLSLLYEIFVAKNTWPAKIGGIILFGLTAAFVPIIAQKYLFLYSAADRYTFLLPFSISLPIPILPQIFYGYILVLPLVLGLISLPRNRGKKSHTPKSALAAANMVVYAVLFAATLFLLNSSIDRNHKLVLTIDRLAEEKKWEQIIQTARENSGVNHRLITLQYNRALYHTGRLNEELFGYPQIEGEQGLFRSSNTAFETPVANIDLTFEMGNLNSAQVWANEALSIEGESARVLERLVLIHLCKKEFSTADLYLNRLAKTLFHQKWVAHYRGLLEQPARISTDPVFNAINAAQVADNFLMRYGQPYSELVSLNENNPQNRMAFEYLVAYDLLSRRLDRLMDHAPRLAAFYGNSLPRHVEEAIILIAMSGVEHNLDLESLSLRTVLVERFRQFMAILAKYKNDANYAQHELVTKFGDTYWYYHLYHKPQEL